MNKFGLSGFKLGSLVQLPLPYTSASFQGILVGWIPTLWASCLPFLLWINSVERQAQQMPFLSHILSVLSTQYACHSP